MNNKMYGSTEKVAPSTEGLLDEKKESAIEMGDNFDPNEFLKKPFGETFDSNFWKEVTDLFGDGNTVGWNEALNRVRLERIKKGFEVDNKDPIIALITEVYDKYEKYATGDQIMASFKQQLTTFVGMLLEEDAEKVYENLLVIPGKGKQSVLHLAADRNLLSIVKVYLDSKMSGGVIYMTTNSEDLDLHDRLPLEFALTKKYDATASFLASKMYPGSVRALFEYTDYSNARFRFADFIVDETMTQTVVQILEACINPDWPFTPVQDENKKEKAWSEIPDTTLRFHFYYRLLDGDLSSEPPRKDGVRNPDFNHRETSCLQLLAKTPHNKATMYHPVVRKLVDNKWESFGRKLIWLNFFMYLTFLVFMTCALFTLNNSADVTSKEKAVSIFRNVCEVITILCAIIFLINELDEMEKERLDYWKDPFNYLDLLGLFLILVLIPLRFTDSLEAERAVGAAAYFINCIRVFKYFSAIQTIGIYSKTFFEIIKYDISKFAVIFVIVLLAFGGSVFLSLSATQVANPKGSVVLTLKQIFLREFRALAEGNPFGDGYDSYNDGVVFLLMLNMFVIIVILANILIGQLSWRYEKAMAEASTQFSIDKTMFICRLQNNRFEFLNKRIVYYLEGDYVSGESNMQEYLDTWQQMKKELSPQKEVEYVIKESEMQDFLETWEQQKKK